MSDTVELYEDALGTITLVHGDRAYTTNRFELGESFTEDAQNILDGHFAHMLTDSRHRLDLSYDCRVASYTDGVRAVFAEPSRQLKDYIGAHVDE